MKPLYGDAQKADDTRERMRTESACQKARDQRELLHVAVCQAVASLNQGDEPMQAHGILRAALADYADIEARFGRRCHRIIVKITNDGIEEVTPK